MIQVGMVKKNVRKLVGMIVRVVEIHGMAINKFIL